MKQNHFRREVWMDLSEAAEYLGVHFTTLRRWADAGEISYMRTPGKRRRFSLKALEDFIEKRQQGHEVEENWDEPLKARAINLARASVQNIRGSEKWLDQIDQEQRMHMKSTGHRLMALLLQYNSRSEGGEAFLEEGKRIMGEYSQVCAVKGLSMLETVRIFLFFRLSILDAVHETSYLHSGSDQDSLRLFHRTTKFLDDLILELIGSYPTQIPGNV